MYFLRMGKKPSKARGPSHVVHTAKVVSKAPAPPPDSPPARSTALMRAERGSPPVHLAPAEAHLLDRALAEGQRLQNVLEDAVIAFGRWLLVEVFDNDAKKALDEWGRNPVWLELVRRAGGPSLGVSRTVLYAALRLAANDKRLTDQAWQRLDVGRKQLLLPLREVPKLRQAAQHVMKWNLTQAKTREYVTQLRAEDGKKPIARLTRAGLVGRVRKMRESLGGAPLLRRAQELAGKMSAKERAEVLREMAALRTVLEAMSQAVESG
jgi:hypothetical protein